MKSSSLCALSGGAALWLFAVPVVAQDHSHHHHMPSAPSPSEAANVSDWQIHGHIRLDGVSIDQSGPRGGSKSFVAGMAMVNAKRNLSERDTLELQLMLSPDPFMGKGGYPLLLQAGETADGVNPLIDAQHPHDLFMDMSAKLTRRFDERSSGYVKIGWPSETPFGPTTFMHRPSGENLPTAPITHHWFDSAHVTMGVISTGYSYGPLTVEAARFTGREPDEKRFDLETPKLDSTALRVKWQVSDGIQAQVSRADVKSPEGLYPDVDLTKTSASIETAHNFGQTRLNTAIAWGRKEAEGGHHATDPMDAWLVEANLAINPQWTLMGRYERVHHDELVEHQAHWVAKGEIGVLRTFRVSDTTDIGIGLVRQQTRLPSGLKPLYGDNPSGTVGFVRLNKHFMRM
ncbi:MAG: hypothetical protein QM645_03900 [Asticcacaulis sp.]